MYFWEYLLFICCFIVFYNYAGYAIIACFFNAFKRPANKPSPGDIEFFPSVSFIVAAFNEEDFIGQKILNSLQQTYPAEKIEYIFVTDGSSDKTPEIVLRFPAIKLLHENERSGKSAAVNRAVLSARHDILIFSDANTILNKEAVKNIARHYHDKRTGGIAGEKKVIPAKGNTDEVGAGEGLYWKYESFLKKVDSNFYSVVGAAGELFSLRRELYEPIPHNVILDDFIISLKVAEKGFRIVYEPDAWAMELPSFSMADEHKRKIRIAAGGFQSMGMLSSLLRFWKQPRLSFLYISHRVLRWTLSPLCLVLALLSNLVLVLISDAPLFRITFLAQALFYSTAWLATIPSLKSRFKILKLPYYFVFMNISVIQGFFRFLSGNQPASWEKAKRSLPALAEEQ
ncbi:MAG TPA: glycosyltransferase family 2 protein [Puia sp.]|nr:glycosyltransferase family 2 protein [Puia sp.]